MTSFIVLDDYSDNVRALAAATVISDDLFDIDVLMRSGCAAMPLTVETELLIPGFVAQRSTRPTRLVAILFAARLRSS